MSGPYRKEHRTGEETYRRSRLRQYEEEDGEETTGESVQVHGVRLVVGDKEGNDQNEEVDDDDQY